VIGYQLSVISERITATSGPHHILLAAYGTSAYSRRLVLRSPKDEAGSRDAVRRRRDAVHRQIPRNSVWGSHTGVTICSISIVFGSP